MSMKLLKKEYEATYIPLSTYEKIIYHPIFDRIHAALTTIRSHFHRTCRAIAYARLGYNNWDFDALTVERYLLFKLKRVQYSLLNGHVDYTFGEGPKQLKALKLAIKLLEKLTKDENKFQDLHDKKWGITDVFKEMSTDERDEFIAAVFADARVTERNRKLLYNILAKYLPVWWD